MSSKGRTVNDSFRDRVVGDINEVLDGLAENEQPWVQSWVAHEVCNRYSNGIASNPSGDFWRWNGYSNVREMVRRVIRSRAGDGADRSEPQQFVFEGFSREHLRDYYLVDRDGQEIGVPVMSMTDEEIDAKAALYRAQARTQMEHADELLSFKEWRKLHESAA